MASSYVDLRCGPIDATNTRRPGPRGARHRYTASIFAPFPRYSQESILDSESAICGLLLLVTKCCEWSRETSSATVTAPPHSLRLKRPHGGYLFGPIKVDSWGCC